jgi:hypothetical protein
VSSLTWVHLGVTGLFLFASSHLLAQAQPSSPSFKDALPIGAGNKGAIHSSEKLPRRQAEREPFSSRLVDKQVLCVAPETAAAGGPQFRPLTDADSQDTLAQVRSAADALDQRFAMAGPSADGWKAYLSWDHFKNELQKPKPDEAALKGTYDKLAAGHEGLELKSFANLRNALGRHWLLAAWLGNPGLEAKFKDHIADLTRQIKTLGPHATTEETRKIADQLTWLETFRQTPELVQSVHQRFSSPNFHVQIGKELLEFGVGGTVDDVAPIDDVILGTVVHGTGRTVGLTKVALTPNPTFASFDVLLNAANYSNNVGRNGPVCIYSTGQTGLSADKRMWLDETGLHSHSAQAAAEAHTTINNIVSIKGRALVERIAWRKANEQLCEAEAIASQHAASRLRSRVDDQADPLIQQANQQYEAKARQPLDERRAFPAVLTFDTIASALEIHGREALASQLAAPTAPPALTRPADITVRVHESAINNAAETVLTGMRLTDDMVQRMAVELLGRLPNQLKPEENKEPFTIVFPMENSSAQPITVSFADNGATVTLRGKEYYTGEQKQPGMNVTALYKFEKMQTGYRAVRQGNLQIYGFGLVPGSRRSLRQEGIYSVLQAKFGKIFAPEIKLEGFKFNNGKLAAAGQLVPHEIVSDGGWLAIGYARVGVNGTPPVAPAVGTPR